MKYYSILGVAIVCFGSIGILLIGELRIGSVLAQEYAANQMYVGYDDTARAFDWHINFPPDGYITEVLRNDPEDISDPGFIVEWVLPEPNTKTTTQEEKIALLYVMSHDPWACLPVAALTWEDVRAAEDMPEELAYVLNFIINSYADARRSQCRKFEQLITEK